MSKKIFLLFVCVFVGIAFLTMGVLKAQAAPIKLTYSNFFPPTHIQSKLAEAWCKEVEKRTNGQVFVQYFPGQTLTKAAQCYDGVVTGLSDIGMSCLAYTRGRFPVMSAVDLPFGYTSGKIATKIANEVYQKFMPKELMDTRVMYLHAHGPGLLHTRDKPVRTLEDMKGLRIRATGTSALVAKALGATPVPMPMPETYQSLQKGVVDGSLYPWEANKGWKLGEVTKYCTADFSAAYTTTFFVVMNKDKWNSIPARFQRIIEEINEEWMVKHGEAWDTSDIAGIRYFLRQGGTVIGPDKKEAARWKAAVASIIDDYVAKAKKKGVRNAQEIVDFLRGELEKY
ncbi:MAG: TRAP transporter substrate-binding protein [Deltaproteobacteria bacterium]|nr:TRAP transporter substrate-binding protein [Deltaproteobacteria bacterium]MBW1918920.1 TRAP transporter substrate-binding protein [Deltaproteobacteria bacterium]MBW1935536.1 TRAP transporter substrate-binding protein [Deltaproteobacteria bacterium]MBW1977223.1 TRAP transporter substrate-binding protein [Deltaproteobacteria bacterium]MBW2044361.1 TRAP transporter substrate-binding protein [Deltaproteobacteria bacterium]